MMIRRPFLLTPQEVDTIALALLQTGLERVAKAKIAVANPDLSLTDAEVATNAYVGRAEHQAQALESLHRRASARELRLMCQSARVMLEGLRQQQGPIDREVAEHNARLNHDHVSQGAIANVEAGADG